MLKYLAKKTTSSFFIKLFSAFLSFVLQVFLARILETNVYGIYLFVWTLISMAGLGCTLGLKGSLIRLTSKFNSESRWEELKGLVFFSLQIVSISGFVIGSIIGLITFLGGGDTSQDLKMGVLIGLIGLPFVAGHIVSQSIFQGIKNVVTADIFNKVLRPVVFIVLISLFDIFLDKINPNTVIILLNISIIVSFVIAIFYVFKRLPAKTRNVRSIIHYGNWLTLSLPFLLISGSSVVQGQADVIMLGILGSANDVGIYGVAVKITMLISFGLNASNMIVAPLISEYYSKKDFDNLNKVISISSLGVFIYTLLSSLLIFILRSKILLFFGKSYLDGSGIIPILIIGQISGSLCGPVGYIAMMTDNQWVASKAFGFGAVINVILNLFLIPEYGISGAAIATTISTISWNVILLMFSTKNLEINTTIFRSKKEFTQIKHLFSETYKNS